MGTRKRRAEIAKSESEQEISESDLTTAPVPANPDEHLLQVPGSERALISLTGKGFERALLSKLDWYTYLYVQSPDPTRKRGKEKKIRTNKTNQSIELTTPTEKPSAL